MHQENIALSKAAGRNPWAKAKKPELLCPAGSPAAFDAAIEAGADAIYMGGTEFNARINAKNFTPDEIKSAISRAHAYGIKVYIAANTLIFDREIDDYLRAASTAYCSGADALIVADIGVAALIKKYIPDIELHASTQLSGHNVAAAKRLAEAGFSRMVCAREMSAEDLRIFTKDSPIEAEVFVHGALCVCHSGQCLFSSLVGKRSGNRGECAQPCRLPYRTSGGIGYPLSLKDLCLASHVEELIDMGIASFKIEGRMKSPEYVRDVTRIWRRLLDEGRNATADEMDQLARIFSRGGFTDGYFKGAIGHGMMGVRSEGDKRESRELVDFKGITRRIPISFDVRIKRGEPLLLTVSDTNVTVVGDIPDDAITAPIDRSTVEKCLRKLGGTPYEANEINIDIDDGLMIPISKLNALRRSAIEMMLDRCAKERVATGELSALERELPRESRTPLKTAVFYNAENITAQAKDFFDIIYTPLSDYDGSTNGVILPAVILDSELKEVCSLLKMAREKGAVHALVGNLGHIDIVQREGLIAHGDFRLNVTNSHSMRVCEEQGFEDVILSPELTLPRIRDIGGRSLAVVYGRIPLMVTEKCVGKEVSDCNACHKGKVTLTDRKNISFPVFREYGHRSVIFNSVPIFMADKSEELYRAGISMQHFIFSDETSDEVDEIIDCYKNKRPYNKAIRRMN